MESCVNFGSTTHYFDVDGDLHRENDLPAFEDGCQQCWYFHGEKHRKGNPAVISKTCVEWWVNGLKHRDGGLPAVENGVYNYSEWWVNGLKHRDGGLPAIELKSGNEWWVNGVRHRDGDLPAVEKRDHKEWWFNGSRHRDGGLPALVITHDRDLGCPRMEWYKNGKLHRDDLPAIETPKLFLEWYKHGVRFREYGLPTSMSLKTNICWFTEYPDPTTTVHYPSGHASFCLLKNRAYDDALNSRREKFGLVLLLFDWVEDDLFTLIKLNWQ